ncbi:MAG: GNAT family N-acyltransferase [Planctomycetota bacterium]
MEQNPLDFFGAGRPTGLRAVVRRLLRLVERPLALSCLRQKYRVATGDGDDRPFVDRALSALRVETEFDEAQIERIPGTGPVVLVANHPFGMIEGLVLLQLMRRRRDDGRILGNRLLAAFPELRDDLILVDPYDGAGSERVNLNPIRQSIRWVRDGGMMGIFPAGEVARLTLRRRRVTEGPWSDTVVKLIRRSGATTVPVWFEGANSRVFHLLGLLHPRIRTALRIRELVNKEGRTIRPRIGNPIPPERLESISGRDHQASYLRLRTLALADRTVPRENDAAPPSAPIIDPVPAEEIRHEVEALPVDRRLQSAGGMDVYWARAGEIPRTLREIGRLREVTFREVHEGTGLSVDLSRFDQAYLHLFIYHPESFEIVGAYRLGQTDVLLEKEGVRGLYTSTLFRISRRLLEKVGPALEVGRSFVRPEYQRSYVPLHLLWLGIGHFVARYPRYATLFGPVSINNDYRSTSREILVAFLREHGYWSELSRLVRPRTPLKPRDACHWDPRAFSSVIRDVKDVSNLISEIEDDGKGIPILLKQYLRLGARLLGFNVDPAFGHALDGLVLVDLRRTDLRLLERYLSREGMESFLRYHARDESDVERQPELVSGG